MGIKPGSPKEQPVLLAAKSPFQPLSPYFSVGEKKLNKGGTSVSQAGKLLLIPAPPVPTLCAYLYLPTPVPTLCISRGVGNSSSCRSSEDVRTSRLRRQGREPGLPSTATVCTVPVMMEACGNTTVTQIPYTYSNRLCQAGVLGHRRTTVQAGHRPITGSEQEPLGINSRLTSALYQAQFSAITSLTHLTFCGTELFSLFYRQAGLDRESEFRI